MTPQYTAYEFIVSSVGQYDKLHCQFDTSSTANQQRPRNTILDK